MAWRVLNDAEDIEVNPVDVTFRMRVNGREVPRSWLMPMRVMRVGAVTKVAGCWLGDLHRTRDDGSMVFEDPKTGWRDFRYQQIEIWTLI